MKRRKRRRRAPEAPLEEAPPSGAGMRVRRSLAVRDAFDGARDPFLQPDLAGDPRAPAIA